MHHQQNIIYHIYQQYIIYHIYQQYIIYYIGELPEWDWQESKMGAFKYLICRLLTVYVWGTPGPAVGAHLFTPPNDL